MIHPARPLGAVVVSIGCICLLAACGSSSKSGSGSTGTNPGGRSSPTGFKLSSSQRACLKQKGVTIPAGGFRPGGARGNFKGSPPPNGKFKGKFPKGKLPKGKLPPGAKGRPPGAGFGAGSKFKAAFKACGVSFGGPPQGPQTSTTG